MHQDLAILIFAKIFKKIDQQWKFFIQDCKNKAKKDDQSQIFMRDFEKILQKYDYSLAKDEKESILNSFPGQESVEDQADKRINIARIYD